MDGGFVEKKVKKIESKDTENDKIKKEIKSELLDYLKEQVDIETESAIKRLENKVLKMKRYTIIRKNIIIFALISCYILSILFLYNDGYFDKYFEKEKTNNVSDNSSLNDVLEDEDNNVSDNKLLIEKYSYLLDAYNIYRNNIYLDEFYNGNILYEMMLSIGMFNLDDDSISNNDGFLVVDYSVLESKCKSLFSSDIEPVNFNYLGLDFKYVKNLNVYIAQGTFASSELISRLAIKINKPIFIVCLILDKIIPSSSQ